MPRRLAPLTDPGGPPPAGADKTETVRITLDGDPVLARRGEPVAAALVASGRLAIARSPKFHRPRGPSCMRGGCDGCLARVDGRPNVMTCLVPAAEGTAVETQNALGSRDTDLLRVTDWFFPDGINHHELFAGVPGISGVMQAFARRVAGLGKLPSATDPVRPAARVSVDVAIVGAGPAGMAAAGAFAARGRSVRVFDDALAPGGSLPSLLEARGAFAAIEGAFADGIARGLVEVTSGATVGALYGDELLVVSGGAGAEIVTARSVVFATGAHDGQLAFGNNDLPGVVSARTAASLLARGILVGDAPLVVVASGGGPFGEAFARAAAKHTHVTVVRGEPVEALGSSRVKGIRIAAGDGAKGDGAKKIACDAIVVDAPRAPAFELALQAGAIVEHHARGYVVTPGDGGEIRPGFYAVGELVGTPVDAAAMTDEARNVARAAL